MASYQDKDKYKAIHAYVSPDAKDFWLDFSAEVGCSMTGILEGLSQLLVEGADVFTTVGYDSLIKRARKVDADRRRR